jgi:hypothetical protein
MQEFGLTPTNTDRSVATLTDAARLGSQSLSALWSYSCPTIILRRLAAKPLYPVHRRRTATFRRRVDMALLVPIVLASIVGVFIGAVAAIRYIRRRTTDHTPRQVSDKTDSDQSKASPSIVLPNPKRVAQPESQLLMPHRRHTNQQHIEPAASPADSVRPVPPTQDAPDTSTTTRVETICLVSCVGAKRAAPAPAKDLYRSDWFIKARGYAESVGSCWFILSAKYGVVHPDQTIEPYELTLNTMGVAERQSWARLVRGQMDERMPDADRIVVLAGQRYREFLMEYLRQRAETVDVPMEGLRIGEQLSWLSRHRSHEPAH